MPHFSDFVETSSSCQFHLTELENIISFPSSYLHKTKMSTANSSPDNNPITSSFMTHFSDPTPQTFNRTTFHPKPPSFCIVPFQHKYHKKRPNQQHWKLS